MLKLTFQQTSAELMVRAASTIIFNTLNQLHYPSLALSELAENPQYGFTASASIEEVGAKFVRITDLKDGGINWDTVPYCKCDEPEKYLIYPNDILFARTGATTGKTHLVKEAPYAVFASYLIRIRPKSLVDPEYLYSFFQSDAYWTQILDEKEGSAQPNVNGQKLMKILVPMLDSEIQSAISKFLEVVRKRQDGSFEELPELPQPLEQQRRIMMRVEELVGKVEEVRSLRQQIFEETEAIFGTGVERILKDLIQKYESKSLIDLVDPNRGISYGVVLTGEPYENGVPTLRAGDLRKFRVLLTNVKCIDPQLEAKYRRTRLCGNELLLRIRGGLGEVAVCPHEMIGGNVSREIAVIPFTDKVLPEYGMYILAAPSNQTVMTQKLRGTSYLGINLQDVRILAIPVPPLPE
ncbi:restriction endonuclease subunit S [Nostoc sp.]|uniref:restriction endonuclease subunit S n=1 Tax=Nostoc sp. TaxID=1180 RepID=UPI002FF803BC